MLTTPPWNFDGQVRYCPRGGGVGGGRRLLRKERLERRSENQGADSVHTGTRRIRLSLAPNRLQRPRHSGMNYTRTGAVPAPSPVVGPAGPAARARELPLVVDGTWTPGFDHQRSARSNRLVGQGHAIENLEVGPHGLGCRRARDVAAARAVVLDVRVVGSDALPSRPDVAAVAVRRDRRVRELDADRGRARVVKSSLSSAPVGRPVGLISRAKIPSFSDEVFCQTTTASAPLRTRILGTLWNPAASLRRSGALAAAPDELNFWM